MKLKSFVLVCLFALLSPVFAASQHTHANKVSLSNNQSIKPASSKLGWPGYCEIEIVNNSYDDVRVYGVFDDGVALEPFNVYSFESPHYISLYYYGYCHDGMDIYIDTFYGAHVFAGYVRRYSTVRIVPASFGAQQSAVQVR